MKALITGITGQDGSYMAEFLLEKGYEVFGLVRKNSSPERIQAIASRIKFIEGELTDPMSLDAALKTIQPNELYNLAAQSSVAESWNDPVLTAEVNGVGVLRLLEAVRRFSPKTKFLQASSSEIFASTGEGAQDEKTEIRPRTPYGAAKAFGHHTVVNYREGHGIFSCSCICFSHESPRRGPEFVTRKVSQHVARIKLGLANKLSMGNLDVRRDWGYAGDTVRAMWLALQQSKADDYVIATGETHSVRDLLDIAFSHAGLDWHKYVEVDPALLRPVEADNRCGNAHKARTVLGWKPEVDFRTMIGTMVASDLVRYSQLSKENTALQASGA
jgi:GDPmannose 4,6-dehydratase